MENPIQWSFTPPKEETVIDTPPVPPVEVVAEEPQPPVAEPEPQPAPTPVAEVNIFDKLNEQLGGEVKFNSADEIKELLRQKSEFEKKAQEFEQFNNSLDPITKKTIEMRRNGATDDEVSLFQNLQKIDLTKMDAIDKVKMHFKMNVPDATDEDIDNALLKYFDDDGEAKTLKPDMAVEFKSLAKTANDYLQGQKINSENPESVKNRQTQLQQEQQRVEQLQNTFISLTKQGFGNEIKFDVKSDALKGVEAKFALSSEQRSQVLELSLKQAVEQGINPADTQAINTIAKQYAGALFADQIYEKAYAEGMAKATKSTVKEFTGEPKEIKAPPPHEGATNRLAALRDYAQSLK